MNLHSVIRIIPVSNFFLFPTSPYLFPPPPPPPPLQVNGLSNLFWGWGREDDELYVRMKEAGMTVSGNVVSTMERKWQCY